MEVTFSPAIENKAETKDRNGPISPEEILYSSFIIIKNRISKYGYSEMCDFVTSNVTELLSSAISRSPTSLCYGHI